MFSHIRRLQIIRHTTLSTKVKLVTVCEGLVLGAESGL